MRTIGEDFSQDIKVDEFNLVDENKLTPILDDTYSEKQVEIKTQVDSAKDKLDYLTDLKTLYYGKTPLEGYKSTEPAIKAMVGIDPDIVEAKDAYRQALAKKYTLDGCMNTLDKRVKTVDNLTKLQISGYYNAGRTGGDNAADEMNDSLNRRNS